MIYLIYASAAVHEMTRSELLELLAQSREKNLQLDITGILLYRNRHFLQVLEGKTEQVDALFETIKRDPRHHNVDLLLRRVIVKRNFQDWRMGFINLDETEIDVPGYVDFFTRELRPRNNAATYVFLKGFRDYVR